MKGRDVIELDVRGKSITDTMIIVQATQSATFIYCRKCREAKKAGHAPEVWKVRKPAMGSGDFGDVILHVMQDETRDFYQLRNCGRSGVTLAINMQ